MMGEGGGGVRGSVEIERVVGELVYEDLCRGWVCGDRGRVSW